MYGVVLWCSGDGQKAVIWCEDHGDLAYCQDLGAGTVLEAGDLVVFRPVQSRRMRMAQDVRLVDQGTYAGLPQRLQAASQAHGQVMARDEGSNVVAFDFSGGQKRPAVSGDTPMAAIL